ncbi:hypothetical protein M3231_15030 [Neobacillus mesonae]|nr:hypothetical protein [Neobacillus mesonae]
MIVRINGMIADTNPVENSVAGKLVDIIANSLGNIASDFGAVLSELFRSGIALLNANSAEIITLGIITCAAGMMVSPLVGDKNPWIGRLFTTFWVGVIWRVLI